MVEIQSEGWVCARARNLDGQFRRSILSEEGIKRLQEKRLRSSGRLGQLCIHPQLAVVIERLGLQVVLTFQTNACSCNAEGQLPKRDDAIVARERSMQSRDATAPFFVL